MHSFAPPSAGPHARAPPAGAGRRGAGGRSRQRTLASGAPSAGTAPSKALTREDLVESLRSGCKPKERWRIGTEHEKFGFRTADRRPMDYNEVKHILDGLVTRHGWAPMMEGEFIIGALKDGQSVTLEPGGQFELSGAPVSTLHETAAEIDAHLDAVKALAAEVGVAFMGLGFQPKWAVADVPAMPKGRYKIMREYMPKVGSMGLDMMFRTCTVQVNLDFCSEADMVEKFRTSLALQPVATALFANSPFVDGKPSGFKSFRSNVWTDVDNDRCGEIPFVFEPGFGFHTYVDWLIDRVPMYFVYRDGAYIDVSGESFAAFMAGKLPQLPGQLPTMADWEAHCTTAFPEVRLKKFLEMRGADNGRVPALRALPALWVGLLYDSTAQSEAAALVSDWSAAERSALRNGVPQHALALPFRGATVRELAARVLAIARGGLVRRGLGEEKYLDTLDAVVSSGATAADAMVEAYGSRWGAQGVDACFSEYLY